jgi:hypothetical protein
MTPYSFAMLTRYIVMRWHWFLAGVYQQNTHNWRSLSLLLNFNEVVATKAEQQQQASPPQLSLPNQHALREESIFFMCIKSCNTTFRSWNLRFSNLVWSGEVTILRTTRSIPPPSDAVVAAGWETNRAGMHWRTAQQMSLGRMNNNAQRDHAYELRGRE